MSNAPDSDAHPEYLPFQRYFSLEEAAGMLPAVEEALLAAHRELHAMRDALILMRRIHMNLEKSGKRPPKSEIALFLEKRQAMEQTFHRWVQAFLSQGILLRDMDRGLIDFPYRSSQGEEFLLCWQLGEEGLFYFHDLQEGYMGRKPVTLLPD
jgi:hypothetical protein